MSTDKRIDLNKVNECFKNRTKTLTEIMDIQPKYIMTPAEFYEKKTKHKLEKNCGTRLTGEELFNLMQDFALQQSSKITDEMIEKWAREHLPQLDYTVASVSELRQIAIDGAKAMRDNKIK